MAPPKQISSKAKVSWALITYPDRICRGLFYVMPAIEYDPSRQAVAAIGIFHCRRDATSRRIHTTPRYSTQNNLLALSRLLGFI